MPESGTKPPYKRSVDELKTEITFDIWNKFKGEGSKTVDDLNKRNTKMITELIERLAIALDKINSYEQE